MGYDDQARRSLRKKYRWADELVFLRVLDVKTRSLRILNSVVVASVASTVLAFSIGFAATILGVPQGLDYIVDIYVILLLIGVPLCFAWVGRSDDRARLTSLEREIVTSVSMQLSQAEKDVWDQQVQAISRVKRVSSGDKVEFHLSGTGRNPYLPVPLLIKRDSFAVAVLRLAFPRRGAVVEATVWCDQGRLSAIVYKGDVGSLSAMMGTTSLMDVVVTRV